MMVGVLLRQRPNGWYAYPEHRRGVGGVVRRLLWRGGFDPLTVYERLAQVRREAADWQRWLGAATVRHEDIRAAALRMLDAQRRLRDDWAYANDAGRQRLWRELHEAGDALRVAIDADDTAVPADDAKV